MVIDEWETAKQFQSFFDGNPKVADVMASIGMTGPPEITVFRIDRRARHRLSKRRPAIWHTTASHRGRRAHRNLGAGTERRPMGQCEDFEPNRHAEAWTNRTRTEPKRGWTTS